MKFLDQMNKAKNESNLIHNMVIDIAYIQNLFPKTATYNNQSIDEAQQDVLDTLNTACDNLKIAADTVKSRIANI